MTREWTQEEIDEDYFRYEDDEPELIIVCPDDMCRGSFDGEGPPCGRWQDSCVRFKERSQAAQRPAQEQSND